MRAHRVHLHLPPGLGAPADHQVHLVPVEQGPDPFPVAGFQPYPGQRMLAPEPAEYVRHHLLGGGGHRGDPQFPALGIGAGGGGERGLVEQAEDAAGVTGVGLARVGQPEASPIRRHQSDAESLLQGGERGGDRGLGDHQFLGRPAHRLAVGHGQERAELVQGHLERSLSFGSES